RVATLDMIKMYDDEKRKLKEALSKVPSRICLTSDVWTSCTTEGYISLTAHYVDEGWKLNSKILNFSPFPPPHSGRELAKIVYGFLEEWGIEQKIFSLTLDNASSNDNMSELLKEKLLMQIQEGLKVASDALHKIRESVKYVKGSEARKITFRACVDKSGDIDTKVGLRLDVATRWNSTFMMLESAIAYRRAFRNLVFDDRNYKHCPTAEEWTRAEKISEDKVIKDMAAMMKVKFDKYSSDYSIVLALGTVLDPRYKFSFIEFCYSKIDPTTCKAKVDVVKKRLYDLFGEYVKHSSQETTTNVSPPSSVQSLGVASADPSHMMNLCNMRMKTIPKWASHNWIFI
ncbi:zinc finger BED domain-containing protein RICESLEEPER, partial [Trifolium medium]|nr:zinc finger BED domain-containing protein RICESLEEPER [Trifolium medium]